MSTTERRDPATLGTHEYLVSAREDVGAMFERVAAFVSEHPTLPEIHSMMVTYAARSRAELDGVAGDFGRSAPADSSNYRGAQFGVYPGHPDESFLQMIISFSEDRR